MLTDKNQAYNYHYRFELIASFSMVVFAVAGIYFRLKGLGKWSFTNDEYYLAQSVRYILDTGLPKFPCGGYYTRGLLYQYAMAPFIALGAKPELAFRLVPFLSYIIALPGLYILSKKITGKIGACLIVSIFSLSITEVEISRFARMYLPFQALFIWYLIFLYRFVIENKLNYFRWMIVLSSFSPFIFEGGIFLVILNFLPFLILEKIDYKHFLIVALIFIGTVFFLSIDFRHFLVGPEAYWPSDIPSPSHGGKIIKPYFLFHSILNKPLWLILFVTITAFSIFSAYKIIILSEIDFITKLSVSFCMALSLINLYGLLLLTFIILMFLGIFKLEHFRCQWFRRFFISILTVLVFFILFGIFNLGEYGPVLVANTKTVDPFNLLILNRISHGSLFIKKIINLIIVLFIYPSGISKILFSWLKVYPLLMSFLIITIIAGLLHMLFSKHSEHNRYYKFIFAIFLILLTIVGMLNVGVGTRYTLFLFPLLFILSLESVRKLASSLFSRIPIPELVAILLISLCFCFSGDFDIHYLLNIDSPSITFRKIFDRRLERHYIMRRDYKGVAQFLEDNVNSGDLVISAHQIVQYYTKKVNYILFGHKNKTFRAYPACNGTKDIWTNLDLLYKKEQLHNILNNSKDKNIWVVVNFKEPRYDEAEIVKEFKNRLIFTAKDGILGVFKF